MEDAFVLRSERHVSGWIIIGETPFPSPNRRTMTHGAGASSLQFWHCRSRDAAHSISPLR